MLQIKTKMKYHFIPVRMTANVKIKGKNWLFYGEKRAHCIFLVGEVIFVNTKYNLEVPSNENLITILSINATLIYKFKGLESCVWKNCLHSGVH